MQVKFFTIPVNNFAEFESELNIFLSSHRIISFEKHLVTTTVEVVWCIIINYDTHSTTKTSYNASAIDYKTVLSEEDFVKYERLRQVRKQIAEEQSVSAFVVATNAELAEISKQKELTEATLAKVNGFGKAKIERFGKQLIQQYNKLSQIKEKP